MSTTQAGSPESPTGRRGAKRHPGGDARTRGVPVDRDDPVFRSLFGAAALLRRYHRHRVLHLARLQRLFDRGRRVILVGNHALDIVDPLLLLATVFEETGRVPHFIGHEKGWFKVPVLRDIAVRFQVVPSRQPAAAAAALRRDGFLMLYPGANREAAMRDYRREPYRLKWQGRMGYLRLALETGADIVFVAAIGSDEAYYQSVIPTPQALLRLANDGDASRYRGARLTFGALGAHVVPGILPFPVRLTHLLSEPLDLGDRGAARRDPQALADLHVSVWTRCQQWLDDALRRRERYSDALDRSIRSAQRRLQGWGI